MSTMTKFTEWLDDELRAREWKPADLAKKAGISRSIISLYVSGEREPGSEVCVKIARAFGVDPVDVLVIAGILEERDKERTPLRNFDKTVISLIQTLVSPEQQEGFIEITRAFTKASKSRGRIEQTK